MFLKLLRWLPFPYNGYVYEPCQGNDEHIHDIAQNLNIDNNFAGTIQSLNYYINYFEDFLEKNSAA